MNSVRNPAIHDLAIAAVLTLSQSLPNLLSEHIPY